MARNRVPLLRLLSLSAVLAGLPFLVASPGAASPGAALVVAPSGGQIVSSDRRIDCGSRCSASYPSGTIVRLVAFDTRDFTFQSWQSGCVGQLRSCFVQVGSGSPVRARYRRKADLLRLTVGGGIVRSSPRGIACGPGKRPSSCQAEFGRDTTVVLTEQPSHGDVFAGWHGPCESNATRCAVRMSADDRSATAGFAEAAPSPAGAIAVKITSVKPQRVVSVPGGIDCRNVCTETFTPGTAVTLHTEVPFGGWSGACRGSVPTCPVVAGAPLVVLASAPIPQPLPPSPVQGGPGSFGINVSVSGRGIVVGGGRINCGKRTNTIRACGGYFNVGQTVLLRALPARGQRFAGWSGFCTGTGPCRLLVDANKVVYATFGP